jgi:hypothetical protein
VNAAQLSAQLRAAMPADGEVVSIDRHGDEYGWRRGVLLPTEGQPPDAWICYSGRWPVDDPAAWAAFFDDLLAELESMTGGADRCRWPLDQPWPLGH